MDSAIYITIAASSVGMLGFVLSKFCYKNFRQHRELIDFLAQRNDELEQSLAASTEKFETSAQRLSDQSRRIAWLETRVRQPKISAAAAKEEVLDAPVIDNAPKTNMTERRHRVLTLASRGLTSEKIAATLGMMQGEVELIMNLNRVAV